MEDLRLLLSYDEPAVAPEILDRIDAARVDTSKGIPHDEILREFGL